jgi:serine/threonine protein kinase
MESKKIEILKDNIARVFYYDIPSTNSFLIGKGNFGCVIAIKLILPGDQSYYRMTEDQMRSYRNLIAIYGQETAIAIKFVIQGVDSEKNDIDREILIFREISDTDVSLTRSGYPPKVMSLKIFKSGYILGSDLIMQRTVGKKSMYISTRVIKALSTHCKEMMKSIIHFPEKSYLYFIEMESCEPGSIWAYIRQLKKESEQLLTKTMIMHIVSQICYAMNIYQKELGLKHFDLKAPNVLLKRMSDYPPGETIFPFEVKIADFGRSETILNPFTKGGSHLPFWFVAPVDWIFTSDKISLKDVGYSHFGMDTDIWSLGLMIIQISLFGTDIREFCHFVSAAMENRETYELSNIHDIIKDYVPVSDLILRIIGNQKGNKPSDIVIKFSLLLSICQIQEYIGNGFLPPKKDFPDSIYYDTISKFKSEIIRTCSYIDGKSGITKNVFETLVQVLKDRIGKKGTDFVRLCMKWSRIERQLFGHSTNKFKQGQSQPHLFEACLYHSFILDAYRFECDRKYTILH